MNPAGLLALDADVARRLPRPEVDDQRLRRECRDGHEQADEQRNGEDDSVHDRSPLGSVEAGTSDSREKSTRYQQLKSGMSGVAHLLPGTHASRDTRPMSAHRFAPRQEKAQFAATRDDEAGRQADGEDRGRADQGEPRQGQRGAELGVDARRRAPASTPTSAAVCPTRRVRIPSRNSPSRMPETRPAIARALFTTLSSSSRAPKATAVRTTPQTTVIARETRIRCRSSLRPVKGRYRSLTIDEADEFNEPARVPIAAEKIAAITRPSTPVGR